MRILILTAAIALGAPVFADELILQNGESIEWKELKDEGDRYCITTPDDRVRTVMKSAVRRFRKTMPPPAPLTGAIFTEDMAPKGVAVDLLDRIDPAMAVSGRWTLSDKGSALRTPRVPHGRILLPVRMPVQYDVLITVRRIAGDGAFYVRLPVGEHDILVVFDGEDKVQRWVQGVVETSSMKKTFVDDRIRSLALMVRKTRFLATLDGSIVIDWRLPDYSLGTIPQKIDVEGRGIMIGVHETAYSINRIALVRR